MIHYKLAWLGKTAFFSMALALSVVCAHSRTVKKTVTKIVSLDFTNGIEPTGPLMQATDGNLYGTAQYGGAFGGGTVFKVTPEGTLTTLYNFCAESDGENTCIDGWSPIGGVIQGADGNFYGNTLLGGRSACLAGCGTVFKITPEGSLTTLFSFCQINCRGGASPTGRLIQATDGKLYGTTSKNGEQGYGTIFAITTDGTLKTIYSFCSRTPTCDDGYGSTGLIEGTDGNFYGTSPHGGESNLCGDGCGEVFKITRSGELTILHSFNFADGEFPVSPLMQSDHGNFYGVTLGDVTGRTNYGSVYKMSPKGALTTLHTFKPPNGYFPMAALVQATDGNFYGSTAEEQYGGTLFQINSNNTYTSLFNFSYDFGYDPETAMIQATNGKLYGVTFAGGDNSEGTVFALDVGLSPFVKTLPVSGGVGSSVTVVGDDLTDATGVAFNGVASAFTVLSQTQLSTTVPAGATTGSVTVAFSSGQLKSNVVFQVRP